MELIENRTCEETLSSPANKRFSLLEVSLTLDLVFTFFVHDVGFKRRPKRLFLQRLLFTILCKPWIRLVTMCIPYSHRDQALHDWTETVKQKGLHIIAKCEVDASLVLCARNHMCGEEIYEFN